MLKTLYDAIKKIASDGLVNNMDGIDARKNFAPTSQPNTLPTKTSRAEKLVTKQKSGAKDTITTFFGKSRQIQTCFKCGKDHMMDVLYVPNDKFVCPTCERKDENETSV